MSKTALQEMSQFINSFEDEPINPIFLRLRIEQLIKKEKEQIINAFTYGERNIELRTEEANKYYNQTYKNDI